MNVLQEMVAHARTIETDTRTPADVPVAYLAQSDLELLRSRLGAGGKEGKRADESKKPAEC
jgi:hypothetical protein